jgi:hypothetical protein
MPTPVVSIFRQQLLIGENETSTLEKLKGEITQLHR